MALDWLTEPISEDQPCGPDLEATDDGAFLDYYYEAESRMPERYFTPGIKSADHDFTPGTLFDKSSINHKAEKEQIHKLLKRSRDLRLLSLLARMMILAGRLDEFAEALEGTADVLEAFPTEVHPKDVSDRRSALDELGSGVLVVMPLQYAEVGGPGEVSLRRYLVANGEGSPRAGEVGLNSGKMLSELGAPGNAKAVDAAHSALSRSAAALTRIKSACLRNDQQPFNPTIDPTLEVIKSIQELIHQGRSDLQPWSAEDAGAEPGEDGGEAAPETEGDAGTGDATPAASAPVAAAPTIVTSIPTRAAALQTLRALETYFATHEPAAPALLLVTQARLLVGRPLVEAIETLLPADAPNTRIDLGGNTNFVLDMARLQMLSNEAASAAAPAEESADEPPVVSNRSEVAGHLKALEEFFRAREPASPIPVLLFRAKTYLEKDFSAVVADLIPPPPQAE